MGPLDDAIAKGKGALEKALGIGIAGYLDTGYTWSTSHPGSPANISGRYFDKDYNKIEFNDFHIALDLPEKRFGVGYHGGNPGLLGNTDYIVVLGRDADEAEFHAIELNTGFAEQLL